MHHRGTKVDRVIYKIYKKEEDHSHYKNKEMETKEMPKSDAVSDRQNKQKIHSLFQIAIKINADN